jgi:hypothetical protein
MTRCLNCGAERTSDECEACGLGSAAAELVLRKKFANRTAIFLVGAVAFVVGSGRYPPLELDSILIFMGVLFFLTLVVALWLERRAIRHLEVELLKRIYYGLVPLPWLLVALLLANGALDRTPAESHPATVVSKFSMPGFLPSRRLVVTSWREGRRYERVPVSRWDFDRFQHGDRVLVRVQGGLVGIPWVDSVDRR